MFHLRSPSWRSVFTLVGLLTLAYLWACDLLAMNISALIKQFTLSVFIIGRWLFFCNWWHNELQQYWKKWFFKLLLQVVNVEFCEIKYKTLNLLQFGCNEFSIHLQTSTFGIWNSTMVTIFMAAYKTHAWLLGCFAALLNHAFFIVTIVEVCMTSTEV